MRIVIFVISIFAINGFSIAISFFPTEIPDRCLYSETLADWNMKYHGTPTYYWTLNGSNWSLASYFEPAKFGINETIKIRMIGFIGYIQNGSANIYLFLSEVNGKPDCTPPDFTKKKYGPYDGYINNSYPNYSDINIYTSNWYIKKAEIDAQPNKRFWIIYHLMTSPPPYPYSDDATDNKNSLTWDPSKNDWVPDINEYKPCWCMHVVVTNYMSIESTSIGTVKELFR
jgi:hypothetical protein